MSQMAEQRPELKEGTVLAGKYQVEKVLGVGGMGIVVAARHLQLDSRVAIKYLAPEALANPDTVARFAREARAAVKITGEHVARVLDVGTFETGAPYLVMEFLDGSDLATMLEEKGALAVDRAVEFVLQACVAVAEAHSLGIVHRDLKPANLFCVLRADGKPCIKVLDFGISKVSDPEAKSHLSMTKTSSVMGSPLYMSPEQMQASKAVDARTDIWSLGVILYELLTGRVPFEGETVTDVAVKVSIEPAVPVRTHRPELPEALDAAILKCLAKKKEERFGSVAELAVAIAEFAPPHAKPLVDRICDILRFSAPPSSVVPSAAASPAPSAPQVSPVATRPSTATATPPPGPPKGAVAATMSAVSSTGGQAQSGSTRPLVMVAAAAVVLGVAVATGVGIAGRRAAPAASSSEAVLPAIASGSPSTSAPPAAASPSAAPVSDSAAPPPAPPLPASVAPSSTPPRATTTVRPRAAVTTGAPPSAPPPAPSPSAHPPHRNALDLGGFK